MGEHFHMGLISNRDAAIQAIVRGAQEEKLYLWLQADSPDGVCILGQLRFKAMWSERGDHGLLEELQANRKSASKTEPMKPLVAIQSRIDSGFPYKELVPIVFSRGESFRYDGLSSLPTSRKDRSNRDEQLIELSEMLTSGVVVVAGGNDLALWRQTLEDDLLNLEDPVLPDIRDLRIVLVTSLDPEQLARDIEPLIGSRKEDVLLFHGDFNDLTDACREQVEAYGTVSDGDILIRVKTRAREGNISIDDLVNGTGRGLTEDYHLITSRNFETVAATKHEAIFKKLLSDAEPVWEGYQEGFPFERTYKPKGKESPRSFLGSDSDELTGKSLAQVTQFLLERSDERRENYTIALPAEPGAGSTTLVRQVAFKMAARGFPVMLAKTSLSEIDYWQLTSYLTEFWRKVAQGNDGSVETSYLLVFDAEHASDHKTREIARLLENDGRNVVVLRVVPSDEHSKIMPANGREVICQVLKSNVEQVEASALYRHLYDTTQKINVALMPQKESWENYVRSTGAGNAYFWVCLRYFILEKLGTEAQGGIQDTITAKLTDDFCEMVRERPDEAWLAYYLAVSTFFRVPIPYSILCHLTGLTHQEIVDATRRIEDRMKYFRIEWYGNSKNDYQLALNNSLSAQLLTRLICENRTQDRIDASVDLFEIDHQRIDPAYPIELLRPILLKLDHARLPHRKYAEKIAVDVLKIEHRVRHVDLSLADKMIAAFDYIPLTLRGTSPTILQARAITNSKSCNLMKIALDKSTGPEKEEWQNTTRNRFKQAESDMKKALSLLEIEDIESTEDPHVLKATLANIYAAWSAFERAQHNIDGFNRTSMAAGELFVAVMDDWPDSTYARYGLARLLYESCRDDSSAGDDTLDVENLAQALAALDIQPESSFHDGWVRLQLVILAKLNGDQYKRHVDSLIARGYEIGFVIKARRIYQEFGTDQSNTSNLDEAIHLLEQAQDAPHRSSHPASRQFLLYQCLSKHPKQQWNFPERFMLLSELDRSGFRMSLPIRHTYAVLCYQMEREDEGNRQFRKLRSGQNQGTQIDEFEYWREVVLNYTGEKPAIRLTTMKVVSTSKFGGWGSVQGLRNSIPFYQRHPWGQTLRLNQLVLCAIQFFRSGPRAVPRERER
jgi:hypothetical protein